MNDTDRTKDEQVRAFLQEGFASYAPALVSIFEFRRQMKQKLLGVLEEFETQLASLGLPIDDLDLEKQPKLDDVTISPTEAHIALVSRQNGFSTKYHVDWDTQWAAQEQIRVGAFIWPGKDKCDQLFALLEKQIPSLRKTQLAQDEHGLPRLFLDCAGDLFSRIEEPFRVLVEEWVELLTRIGGVKTVGAE